MPPNRSPLDEHRAEIEELYKSGLTHDELLNTINSRHGAQFSITTLQRRLSAWGVNKGEGRRRTRVKNDELAVIQARVYAMMASHTDQQIFEVRINKRAPAMSPRPQSCNSFEHAGSLR